MSPPKPLHITARKACLVLIVALALLPFGVPRWLNRSDAPVSPRGGANFAALCRAHGGTPTTTPGAGTTAQRICTVRYGRRVYVMDAITPNGFDQDTARYQRLGCQEAQQGPTASGRRTFVYHPDTGVCEHRP